MWEDNVELDLKEIVCEGVGWFHLVLDTVQWRVVVNTVMNFAFRLRRSILGRLDDSWLL